MNRSPPLAPSRRLLPQTADAGFTVQEAREVVNLGADDSSDTLLAEIIDAAAEYCDAWAGKPGLSSSPLVCYYRTLARYMRMTGMNWQVGTGEGRAKAIASHAAYAILQGGDVAEITEHVTPDATSEDLVIVSDEGLAFAGRLSTEHNAPVIIEAAGSDAGEARRRMAMRTFITAHFHGGEDGPRPFHLAVASILGGSRVASRSTA